MKHDIVIRNGMVIDGTGAPGRVADVAIAGDRVVEVGPVSGAGRREINADGRIVTPGFVDIHSHLDAQVAWDPILSSSCWHGVTSVVIGNCGVTFAPCRPDDRRFLAEMMESVEDIPADGIMNGLPWDWISYGEYLRTLDRMPKGLNVGGMVGHCAVRYYVMGDRSAGQEPASADEIAQMCALVEEAMQGGALGFSTSRTRLHKVPDGRHVPGTWADTEEMMAIGAVLGRLGRGVFESAPRFEGDTEHYDKSRAEIAWMSELSRATGRPVTFGISQANARPELYRHVLEFAREGNARGGVVRPQTTVRGIGVLFGLSCSRTPWDNLPGWKALRGLSLQEKVDALKDPARRAALVAEADGKPGWVAAEQLYFLDPGDAAYYPDPSCSLAGLAAARGVSPAAAFCAAGRGDCRARAVYPRVPEPAPGCGGRNDGRPHGGYGAGRRGRPRGPDHGRQPAHLLPARLGAGPQAGQRRRGGAASDLGHRHPVRHPRPRRAAARRVCRCERHSSRRPAPARARVRTRLSGRRRAVHPARGRL
jgi:N-acyl-D-amino-acid deacylase